jgi:hypothetical protein
MRRGRTEKRHHSVTNVLVDRTPISDDNAVDEGGIAAYQLADLFRIERSRYCGESTEIGEEYGDLPTLPCRRAIGMTFGLSWARPGRYTPLRIAANKRLRWPRELMPNSFRSASVSLPRTAKSMSFSPNAAAY